MKTHPTATPTLRAATPVSSVTENAGRVRRVGDRPHEARKQVPDSVRGHRPLHGPEVHRPGPAPRHPLDRDRVAEGLDGADQGHEHEGRKERPEHRPELEVEARPPDLGEADPRGRGDPVHVVDPVEGAEHRAGDDPDDRRPESKGALRLEGDADDDEGGRESAHGRGLSIGPGRHIGQHAEDDGHHRHRDEHDDGPRHGRGEDPPQEGEPGGERELEERGDDHQGREHGGTALDDRGHAHGDERPEVPIMST